MRQETRELLQALLCCELRAYENLRHYERALRSCHDSDPGECPDAVARIAAAGAARVAAVARANELDALLMEGCDLDGRLRLWQKARSSP